MALLWILLYLPAATLMFRAFSSRDPIPLRWAGGLVALVTAGLPLASYVVRIDLGQWVLGLFAAAIIFLLGWAAVSKDPVSHRIAAASVGVVGAFPILLLYLFANHYRE